ncbi:MAG: endopeptidase La [Planctomycetota bacterium]|nr:endopeptidase La [Planctomycetota bacterium]
MTKSDDKDLNNISSSPPFFEKEEIVPVNTLSQKITMELPIMTIHDLVIYPGTIIPLIISHKGVVQLIDDVLASTKTFGFVGIKPSSVLSEQVGGAEQNIPAEILSEIENDTSVPQEKEMMTASVELDVKPTDLYEYGCRVEIVKMFKIPDGTVRLLVQGVEKIKLDGIIQRKPYLKAKVLVLKEDTEQGAEVEAFSRTALGIFMDIVRQMPYLPVEELRLAAMNITSPLIMCYFITSNMGFPMEEKQRILELNSSTEKLKRLIRLLNREAEVLRLGSRIQSEITQEITKAQREQILREQMRIIQRELGETDSYNTEINKLREQIAKARLPEEANKIANDELNRLSRIHPSSAEYTVARTYLDWLINLPWSISTEDNLDINRGEKILDEDHYGLEKVKGRILEYLAVRKLKPDMKGPILCFVGPPGVGKTSLGKSIARALGRKFVRFSLGGVRDEAEIRGHRRTYIGALPGRVIQWIKKAGSKNPVFMLDEIDKIGMDFRGDPASALLEVLDPEQNNSFSDHYLEVPFDLSSVMFITTANILDTIPPALRDRMEVLELLGYIAEEKIKITQEHLIPKQLKEHGITEGDIKFTPELLSKIITGYTREAGVRNLEREIATVCRKIAKDKASEKIPLPQVTISNIEGFLGPVKFFSELAGRKPEQGVATGMVWTPVGGEIVFVESTRMKGSNNLILTGHLGDVMKESARAALSYIRSHSKELKISDNFFKGYDIHIHVPAGAIPKDGPSAGITIAISLISLFMNKPVRNDVAMTGEITLRGKILPVGGIKEKVIGARRAGIRTIILPKENQKDLKEIPQHILDGLKFHLIDKIEDALKLALMPSR